MTEYRTDVVVTGRSEGLRQVGQEAQRVNREIAQSSSEQAKQLVQTERQMGRVSRALINLGLRSPMGKLTDQAKAYMGKVEDLEDQLEKLARKQVDVADALGRTKKGTAAYDELEKSMRGTEDASRKVEQQIRRLERAHKDEAQAVRTVRQEMKKMEGAFRQGFIQGAIQAPFLQRGPGAARQAMGMMVGRQARGLTLGTAQQAAGIAGGFAQAPFSGIGGIAQGLSGIPIVGGMLSGQLQTAAGFSQRALALQQTQMAVAPQMGGLFGPTLGAVRAARGQAMAGVAGPNAVSMGAGEQRQATRETHALMVNRTQALAKQLVASGDFADNPIGRVAAEAEARSRLTNDRGVKERMRALASDEALTQRRGEAKADYNRRRQEAGNAAERRLRASGPAQGFMASLAGQGAKLGLDQQAALQMTAQAAQVGGGGLLGAQQQGMVGRTMAARLFGVGAETSGAFIQAGRRGGLVGGQGRGGAAMEEAMANAMRLGLEGSELADYMSQVAEGIQSWKTTGIPINERSLGQIGAGMAQFGMGGVRGGAVARGMQQYGQRLAQQGPQDGVDIMALQTLGGVTGKGGLAEYVQGLRKIEEGKFGVDEVQKLFGAYTRAGAGSGPQTDDTRAAGALTFRRSMYRKGINMGFGEIDMLQAAQGGTLNAEQRAEIESKLDARRAGAGRASAFERDGLVGSAAGRVPAAVRRQVEIANRQLVAGQRMLSTVQTMESATTNVTNVFTKLAKPLEGFSGWVEQGTKGLDNFVNKVGEASGTMEKLSLAANLWLGAG